MLEMIELNRDLYKQNYHEFYKIFGIKLSKYFDNLLGFDIIEFDDNFIQSPDGQSMEDVIQAEYGNEGVNIIKSLLKI